MLPLRQGKKPKNCLVYTRINKNDSLLAVKVLNEKTAPIKSQQFLNHFSVGFFVP